MSLPGLTNIRRNRDIIPAFNGMNRTNEAGDTEMSWLSNMNFREYPYLRTREKRFLADYSHGNILGMYGGDAMYIVDEDGMTILMGNPDFGGRVSYEFSDSKKYFARMGNRLVIFPDAVVYEDGAIKPIAVENTASSVTFTLTDAEGTAITYHDDAYWSTHTPSDGDYKMTKVEGVSELQRYSGTSSSWYVVTTSCVMITANGIGSGLNKSDGVRIDLDMSGVSSFDDIKAILTEEEDGHRYATYPLLDVTENAITFYGLLTQNKTVSSTLTVSREVPDIAYICECGNRLWGCNKEGTEIYASKLGDPFNFNCFEGISTDSWAATVGSQGKFTGAITYLGMPLFFKEESLLKVSPSATGAHVTKEVSCRGVQEGCAESLCIVNELLYYKAPNAFVVYDGSLPQSISKKLGDLSEFHDVVCGRDNETLFAKAVREDKEALFVYDATKGIWASEDGEGINCLTTYKNALYGAKNEELIAFHEDNIIEGEMESNRIEFTFISKEFDYTSPDAKYITKMLMSCHLYPAAEVNVCIAYDRSEKFERICHIDGHGEQTVPVIFPIRRCHSFKIMVYGKGDVMFYSITKYIAEGSDKP